MPPDALYVLELRRHDETFTTQHLTSDLWRPKLEDSERLSVAMVLESIVGADADVAFACDFLAVAPKATIEAIHPLMLQYRAGTTLAAIDLITGHLTAARLFELGLAAFLIETDAEMTERQIQRQADTMLGLAQARRVSAPKWFYHG